MDPMYNVNMFTNDKYVFWHITQMTVLTVQNIIPTATYILLV